MLIGRVDLWDRLVDKRGPFLVLCACLGLLFCGRYGSTHHTFDVNNNSGRLARAPTAMTTMMSVGCDATCLIWTRLVTDFNANGR